MAKKFSNDAHDALLAELATANVLHVTSAEPANHAGIAAVSLADVALSTGLGGGDWGAAQAGDVSGRKTTLAEQAAITVDSSGSATHVVTSDGSTLQSATTCTTQSLTAGNTVTVPAHDYESQTPT